MAIALIRTAIIEGMAETGEETEGGEVAEEVSGIEDRGPIKWFSNFNSFRCKILSALHFSVFKLKVEKYAETGLK